MTHQPGSDGQVADDDRQTHRLLGLGVVAVVAGAVAFRFAPVDGDTLYRGLMLTGVLALAYVQLRR